MEGIETFIGTSCAIASASLVAIFGDHVSPTLAVPVTGVAIAINVAFLAFRNRAGFAELSSEPDGNVVANDTDSVTVAFRVAAWVIIVSVAGLSTNIIISLVRGQPTDISELPKIAFGLGAATFAMKWKRR